MDIKKNCVLAVKAEPARATLRARVLATRGPTIISYWKWKSKTAQCLVYSAMPHAASTTTVILLYVVVVGVSAGW